MTSPLQRSIADEVALVTPEAAEAYLAGAAHDGTLNRTHNTFRFAQREVEWLLTVKALLRTLGHQSWIYEEGGRGVWVAETKWRPREIVPGAAEVDRAYSRGYFDAEGGVPKDPTARFYIQFVQKDFDDLSDVRSRLMSQNISCGELHNPSARVDPNYWRFYVRARSHSDFISRIGSWHPRKRKVLSVLGGRAERVEGKQLTLKG